MFELIFIKPVVNILFLFYTLFPLHDLGISVIIVTLLIRGLLWPLAAKSLHSQRKLQAIQPKIKELKEKHKGDPKAFNVAVFELYKEKEVNPFSSCLLGLIQIPFMIALFLAFRNAISVDSFGHLLYGSLRNLGVLKEILKNKELFQPFLLGLVDLTKASIILATLAGALQFWQSKMLLPKHQDETQRMMSQMNYFLPVMIFIFAIKLPAIFPLYWVITTLVMILQQYLIIRHDVLELEEKR